MVVSSSGEIKSGEEVPNFHDENNSIEASLKQFSQRLLS